LAKPGKEFRKRKNQPVRKKKIHNKAAHTTAANARLFHFEPTENKDLRIGSKG